MVKVIQYYFFCLIISFPFKSFSQSCTDQTLLSIKGKWKKSADANVFPEESFPKNQFPQVVSRIDNMKKIVLAAYPEPTAAEASWYRCISGKALVKEGPVPFEFTSAVFNYYCNNNAPEVSGETDNWLYVWANQLNWFAENVNYYTISKQPVYLLTPRAGELNGEALYMGVHNRNSNTGIAYSRALIITRGGQMPYVPVSRKAFLKANLKYEENQYNKNKEAAEKYTPVKTDQEEEAYKKKQLAIIEGTVKQDKQAKAKENFLKNYVSSKDQKEKVLATIKKDYENNIRPAVDYLANASDAELQMPAIVDFAVGFKEFSSIEKGGRELVRLNPGYFDMTLPRYVPQFLIVYWRWDDHAAGKYFNRQVEDHLDFDALKKMLDK
jgi:hypothetical protein